MYFILCQPATKRFEWELEVCLTNLKSLGMRDIILLFSGYDDDVPKRLHRKYDVDVEVFPDSRQDKSYIPSIKPYLWWQFLKHNPDMERGEYFYMDADVIFRELPDFKHMKHGPDLWPASDTESYLGPAYVRSKGPGYLASMAEIVGLSMKQVDSLRGHSAGAQWFITNPKADYWKKVYEDSSRLYRYFKSAERIEKQKRGKDYVPLQKWTAEMWAQLWNMPLFGVQPMISHELDFAFATAPINDWDRVKILHNAGVTAAHKDLFFKGKYVHKSPFGEDFSYVSKNKCSYKYVQAIQQVTEG